MKRISAQFKLADDFMIVCNHKKAVLADKGIFNLGDVSLWLCMGCTARIREQIVTGILADAAARQMHTDGTLQELLKDRIANVDDLRQNYEGAQS